MKSVIFSIFITAITFFGFCGCSSKSSSKDEKNVDSTEVNEGIDEEDATEKIDMTFNKEDCFIVISKKYKRLRVYAQKDGKKYLLKQYPVCLSKNLGQKQEMGDMRTPESPKDKPFRITQIQDASEWCHDFGDGRGSILAYGHWFLRLDTPGFSGVGIHGSTNNENSVPGRASEGCIRLRDNDIIDLKETFAYVDMLVTVQAERDDALPFETEAIKSGKHINYTISNSEVSVSAKNKGGISARPQVSADNGAKKITTGTPKYIKIKGVHVSLRLQPNREGQRYEDEKGNPFFPNDGDNMSCLGESGNFYKVLYQGKEVYVSKDFCTVE